VRRSIALGAVLALAAPAVAQPRDMYVTDDDGNLHRFDSRYPGVLLDTTPITGLPAAASVIGMISARPPAKRTQVPTPGQRAAYVAQVMDPTARSRRSSGTPTATGSSTPPPPAGCASPSPSAAPARSARRR
jgi:hypothetical protein